MKTVNRKIYQILHLKETIRHLKTNRVAVTTISILLITMIKCLNNQHHQLKMGMLYKMKRVLN